MDNLAERIEWWGRHNGAEPEHNLADAYRPEGVP